MISLFIEELRDLIGSPPAGYEFLEYVLVGLFCLIMLQSLVTLISGLFRLFGGK